MWKLALLTLIGCGDDGSRHIIDAHGTGSGSSATATLSQLTLFRTDSTGTNVGASGGHVNNGAWTSLAGAQNIPGNYVAHVFVARVADPAAADFITLPTTIQTSTALYFFADSDDLTGGTFGFGVNLWIAGATTPSISTFGAPTSTFTANTSTGCTAAFDGTCATAAGTMTSDNVALTGVSILTVGGAPSGACPDKVGSNNHNPALLDMPNGICDTTGSLTFVVN